MESKREFWMDMYASDSIFRGLSAAPDLEDRGSGDFLSHDGSLTSRSSSSSERNSSTDLIDGAAEAIALLEDGEVRTMLQDAEVRAVLRKVMVNEDVLNKAIQSLGGGEKGLQSLVEYIMVWVKQQRDIQPLSQQSPPPSPVGNFSTGQDEVLQPSSDAFPILGGSLQCPPTTQPLDQEMRYTRHLKSRKLMTGEPEMGAGLGGVGIGFCPSSFISSPEDCTPEVLSPDIKTPYNSLQHIGMPFAEPTPAMATKAARRHRMTRQRQSFRARAASPAATAPVSVDGESLWSTNGAPSPAMTSLGMSGAPTPSPRARVAAAREGRSMDYLSFVLRKELRPSDVSHLGRIMLPKKDAELRMPSLETRKSVSIQMEDFDSGHAWNLRYRFWPNDNSRMYVLENTAAFVMSHGLVEGDLLVIYRNLQGGYVLRGMKKKTHRLDIEPVQDKFAHSSAKGFPEELTSPKENGMFVQRLYEGGPPDKGVKEEPVTLDDNPFLKEMLLSMGPSLGSDSICLETLERFPSLNLDFSLEEMMAASKAEPEG